MINESLDQLTLKARHGDTEAQMTLGVLYESGLGVSRDLVEAYNWYSRARLQDHHDAHTACLRLEQILSPSTLQLGSMKMSISLSPAAALLAKQYQSS